MQSDFFKWLTSNSIGTIIAIIIGGIVTISGLITAIIAIIKAVKSTKEKIKNRQAAMIQKEIDEREYRKAVLDSFKNISDLTAEVRNNNVKFENELVNIHEKIEDVERSIAILHDESLKEDKRLYDQIDDLDTTIDSMSSKISSISRETKILTKSSKDSIKAYITDTCEKVEKQGYIDIYVLSNCEAMYEDYLAEKGDTFIEGKMNKLRQMKNSPDN